MRKNIFFVVCHAVFFLTIIGCANDACQDEKLDEARAMYKNEAYNDALSVIQLALENCRDKDSELDLQFHLVLGQVYTQLYGKANEKEYFGKTIDAYKYALKINPNNLSANYNMGIVYYNEGVNQIKKLDYCNSAEAFSASIDFNDPNAEIPSLEKLMVCYLSVVDELSGDKIASTFQLALPYLEKVYELDPQHENTLIALAGIYFALEDYEKVEYYQKMNVKNKV
ncbi:hypothetical protein JYU20_03805 [Bacteroidales bacterium AH-315-I05]|nr:hypothetical protein [Bacteroidales bacterium AH-315-I05]